jgi:hypothetical protein
MESSNGERFAPTQLCFHLLTLLAALAYQLAKSAPAAADFLRAHLECVALVGLQHVARRAQLTMRGTLPPRAAPLPPRAAALQPRAGALPPPAAAADNQRLTVNSDYNERSTRPKSALLCMLGTRCSTQRTIAPDPHARPVERADLEGVEATG